MSSKLSGESFVTVVEKSGLVDPPRLAKALAAFEAAGGDRADPIAVSEHLIGQNSITRWQAEKLLQGKHKGFFLGKYRLLSLLGRGGMSSVYLAEHTLMRRRCAIKVLPAKRVADSSYLARFHREAQAVASLDHPNIVRAYDVDQQTDRDAEIHFLVMEYVDGLSLQDLVIRDGPLPYADAADHVRQAAVGLAHAHKAGMVHRDVKPANLLLDPQGTIKILDLGLARFFGGSDEGPALTLKHEEKVLGTADYLAPEQALDSHTVDIRADIYSLGGTFYYLLTGHPPFNEGTLAQRLLSHQSKEPPSIEIDRADVPASLVEIVRKMMAKRPDDRFSTAQELADALLKWLSANADAAWKQAHADLFTGPGSSVAMPARVVAPLARPVATAAPASEAPPADPALASFFRGLEQPPAAPPPSPSSSKLQNPPPSPRDSTPAVAVAVPANEPVPPANTASALIETHPDAPALDATVALPVDVVESPPTAFEFTSPYVTDVPPPINIAKVVPQPVSAPKPPAAKPAGRKAGAKRPLNLVFVLGSALGIALSILGVGALLGWFDQSGPTPIVKKSKSKTVIPETVPKADPWETKRETTVGRDGEFATITEALDAVRQHFKPAIRSDRFLVKIMAGTYPERINLVSKQWSPRDYGLNLVLRGEGAVTLSPTGADPVLRLDNAQGVHIINFNIKAEGKPVAIELAGTLDRTLLQKLNIEGFQDAGLHLKGAIGSSFSSGRLFLDELRLQTGAATAVAVRAERGTDDIDCGNITFQHCRFLGPLAAGLSIAGKDTTSFEIRQCIFAETQFGLDLKAGGGWREFVLANNTFYKGQTAIRVEQQPEASSKGLSIQRNLFVEQTGPAMVIEQGYNEDFLLTHHMLKDIRQNWTTQTGTTVKGTIELWSDGGQQGLTTLQFVSTDPGAQKFLAPTNDAPQRSVPGRVKGEPVWLGAVGP
jgi:serine/threonine protein kinase